MLVDCTGPTITRGVRQLLQGLVLSDVRQGIFDRPNDPRLATSGLPSGVRRSNCNKL